MVIQATIFDRDGVLLELDMQAAATFFGEILPISFSELVQRSTRWGETVSFPRDLAEERSYIRGFWDRLCDQLDLPSATRQKLQGFDYTSLVTPYPDARPALLVARQKGLKIGVLSNFALASIEASLDAANLLDLVDVASSASMLGISKPDPRAYLAVTKALGVDSHATIHFDNKPQHVAGARALGMAAYLVDRQRDTHELANGMICDLNALPEILLNIS